MPPTAIISDIHANAEALRRVFEDIDRRAVSRIICLGDIIGYGPEPLEAIDMVRARCEWCLMGNHDFGVLYEPTNFNPTAEAAAYWTRERLDAEPDPAKRASRYEFLGRLRVRVVEPANGFPFPLLAVHGSPRRPINEYIVQEDVQTAPDKMEAIFDRIDRVCIVGHTHQPGVFNDEPDFWPPTELGETHSYKLRPDEKVVINVGSVGQPRDLDPRACYALLHEDRVEFVRVEYDIKHTADKIKSIPQLHDWLGDRLYEGR